MPRLQVVRAPKPPPTQQFNTQNDRWEGHSRQLRRRFLLGIGEGEAEGLPSGQRNHQPPALSPTEESSRSLGGEAGRPCAVTVASHTSSVNINSGGLAADTLQFPRETASPFFCGRSIPCRPPRALWARRGADGRTRWPCPHLTGDNLLKVTRLISGEAGLEPRLATPLCPLLLAVSSNVDDCPQGHELPCP